ncbi:unnamed protein product [Ceutorhynchus assimilis]|uniref:Uncharacterized protein n=1 Tax=Ceutorhynchus assimilis TaxID=467358 RepID=A0A9N9MCM4_9CUCU|nr:unnamed protein product [Ceutorhynchus assimilis]
MAEQTPLGTTKSDLYQAVTSLLYAALQPDSEIQKDINVRLQRIEVIEEYPLVLCKIIGSEGESMSQRYTAAVFLKKYLDDTANQCGGKKYNFGESDIGRIMTIKLLPYMSLNDSKITEIVSYCIAALLSMGFWNSIGSLINDMLLSGDPYQVGVAITIIYKATDSRFLKCSHYCTIDYKLFDLLLAVLNKTNISLNIRILTIRPMFSIMKYLCPDENYLQDCVTKFTEEIEKNLNEPYSANFEYGLKSELLKYLNYSISTFAAYNNIMIPPMLPIIGNLLTVCCEQYKNIIRVSEKPPIDSDESEEEPKAFFGLINGLLKFIFSLINKTYFEVLIEDLDKLIYCVYIFMAYDYDLNHNEMNNYNVCVRNTCGKVLKCSLDKIESRLPNGKALFFKSMHNVFQRFNTEIEQTNDTHKVYFMSRLTESMILGSSFVQETYVANDELLFPLKHYLNYWTSLLEHCDAMLQGRILWIGSIYCAELTTSVMECHFNFIMANLEGDNENLLVASGEALSNYLKGFRSMIPDKQFIITRCVKQIMNILLNILKKPNDFPLNQSLNTLGYLVKSHSDVAKENIEQIEDILINITMNHIYDPNIMNEVVFICVKLAQAQGFTVQHDRFIHFLLNFINTPPTDKRHNNLDKALDILNTICLYSPSLDEYLVLQTFLNAVRCLMLNTERETAIDESAENLLTTLIVKGPNQINFISHSAHKEQFSEFPRLLEMLIQQGIKTPRNVLGKLVIVTMFSFPELMLPHHETILRNVITGCANHDREKIRTNWIIFIFICMLQTNETIRYLSFLPGPSGGSALSFILKLWGHDFFSEIDPIEKQIIVLSLERIIQYCFENPVAFEMMQDIQIPFEMWYNNTSTRDTFNGIDYLYYLLIQCILYESLEGNIDYEPPLYNFSDFGEYAWKRHREDEIFLYYSHPFSIDFVQDIIHFLQKSTEPYFSVVRRFLTPVNHIQLKSLGCITADALPLALPEQIMHVQEAME